MDLLNETCRKCGGQCCKVGFIVRVFPNEALYNDEKYVHRAFDLDGVSEFRNMKSNGDGYTCIALDESTGKCTIWNKRPQMCKDLEVDGKQCTAIRKAYGRP